MSISNARIPIVKCVDSKSGLSCDISFKNKNAVHNSNFIKDIISCHETIFCFAIVIRYWALRQSLAGGVVGGGGLHINNYALTMLVIFFFQNENVLPSVKRLQDNLRNEEKVVIDGWEFGVDNREINKIKSHVDETLNEKFEWVTWLRKFFLFYLSFDYDSFVISTFAGKSIPRKSFQDLAMLVNDPKEPNLIVSNENNNKENINEDMIKYWEQIKNGQNYCLNMGSPLCVQDPFEQNFCVSRSFSKVGILNWRNQCRLALEYLKESKLNTESGILGLFKMSVPVPKNKKEQFEIIEKIQSAIGNKISLPTPKKKTKTRTGKQKTVNSSAKIEADKNSDNLSNRTENSKETSPSKPEEKTTVFDVKKRSGSRKNKPKPSNQSVVTK